MKNKKNIIIAAFFLFTLFLFQLRIASANTVLTVGATSFDATFNKASYAAGENIVLSLKYQSTVNASSRYNIVAVTINGNTYEYVAGGLSSTGGAWVSLGSHTFTAPSSAGTYNARISLDAYTNSSRSVSFRGYPFIGNFSYSVTAACTPSIWTPLASTVCAGSPFSQTSNCGTTQSAIGTKTDGVCCIDSTWTPDTSNVCSTQTVTQASNCGTIRVVMGTKLAGTFLPIPSDKCLGEVYSQTDGCTSLGATGTNPALCPNISIIAAPAAIANGSSSILSWTSSNTTTCTASGDWSGAQAVNGSASVNPTPNATSSYNLTCLDTFNNSSTKTANVTATCAPSSYTCFNPTPSCTGKAGQTLTEAASCVDNCSNSAPLSNCGPSCTAQTITCPAPRGITSWQEVAPN
ncbi:MAG: hypothetical protein HGA36_02520 [Candidatus Moranbacteria bacterium]|nr:hypothetical protein [Candidatus Moranbacteria bacterium]